MVSRRERGRRWLRVLWSLSAVVLAEGSVSASGQEPTETGRLLFQSEPSGAQVEVDGANQGVTPLDLGLLSPGKHQISLSLAGFLPEVREVVVEAGGTETLRFDMRPTGTDTQATARRRPGKWRFVRPVLLAATGAGATAAIASAASNSTPVAGTVTVTPSGTGIAGVTEFAFSAQSPNDPDREPITCSWDFGDGSAASGMTASHVFERTGDFRVTFTVSDGRKKSTTVRTVTIGDITGEWSGYYSLFMNVRFQLRQNGRGVTGTSLSSSSNVSLSTVSGPLTSPRHVELVLYSSGSGFESWTADRGEFSDDLRQIRWSGGRTMERR